MPMHELVSISTDNATAHTPVLELSECVLNQLGPEASRMARAAGLPGIAICVSITDDFTTDVESHQSRESVAYTTQRAGGVVGAMTLDPHQTGDGWRILVNSTAFGGQDSWARVPLPYTLGHEVAHCLIGERRRLDGGPQGYSSCPESLLDTIGYTALNVCDEWLADEMGRLLVPPSQVVIHLEDGDTTATDRQVLAAQRLDGMSDALDHHVYPALAATVRRWDGTDEGLQAMTLGLVTGIQEALVLSAHYRSAVRDLAPDLDAVCRVTQHRGTRLYLAPFWARVGPVLESRLANGPLMDFASEDQRAFDEAAEGVTGFWRALGVRFELLDDSRVYVHVDEPLDDTSR